MKDQNIKISGWKTIQNILANLPEHLKHNGSDFFIEHSSFLQRLVTFA